MVMTPGVSVGQQQRVRATPEGLLLGELYEPEAFRIPVQHQANVNSFNTLLDMRLPGDGPSVYGMVGKFLVHRTVGNETMVVVRSVIHAARGNLGPGTGRSISTIQSAGGLFGEAHSFVAAQEGQPRPLTPIHYAKLSILTRVLRQTRVVEPVRLS